MPPKVRLFYRTGVIGANRMDLSGQVGACRTAKEKLPLRSRPLTICPNIVAPLCCIAILHRYSASLFCLPEFSMAFLQGKKILITGLLSNRSIAYGIAQACKREGAELAFTYVGERFKQRITDFADEFGSKLIFDCDVGSDEQINALFAELGKSWPQLDGMVHSIGFAPREAITGDFLEGLSRESFKIAHDISAYSFPAMAKAALPLLHPNSALLTLTYMGSVRAAPNYNTMGLAKASLEASVRYLAESLGPKGVRVNGISAGPIKTLAASGIKDFGKLLGVVAAHAPLRRNVTIEEVGNTAAFLLSDLASGITSEITYVDGGFSNVLYGPGLAE
jgi:enoyl-[acyl-carrier protein] reductase I